MVYKKWNGTSWDESATTLDSNAISEYATISLDTSTNDLYALWIRGSHIYYERADYTAGPTWAWDVSATDWKTTGTNTYVTSNYSGNGAIFAEWTVGDGSPYAVNWDMILIPEKIWLFMGLGLVIPEILRRRRKAKMNYDLRFKN